MTGSPRGLWRRHHEGLLSAVSLGFFLMLIGALFISTPGLSNKVVDFLSDFKAHRVGTTDIYVPVLGDFVAHLDVYVAARQFSLAWGVFLIGMLGARFLLGSTSRRKAQNFGDIVFWLGASYLIQTYLVQPAQSSAIGTDFVRVWYEFWALIIALIGISLIARGVFLGVARARNM